MIIYLLPDLANFTLNPIEMSVHAVNIIGKGCSLRAIFIVSSLCYLQRSYSATQVQMSFFMPSPKNECLISSYVL
jgi:hypothetical protein